MRIRRAYCGVLGLVLGVANAATPGVHGGNSTSAILHADGSIWSIGSTSRDVVATPVRILDLDGVVALAVGATDLALLADGSVWAERGYGFGEFVTGPVARRIPGIEDIEQVSIAASALALRRDGRVFAWGDNSNGTIGDGTRTLRPSPVLVPIDGVEFVAAGDQAAYAVRRDGSLWSWGLDRVRGVDPRPLPPGAPDDAQYQLTPAAVPGIAGVREVFAGASHAAAILDDDSVWTWGANSSGELGRDVFSSRLPAPVPELRGVRTLSLGENFSLALMDNGTVRAWGSNSGGQLGLGDRTTRTSPTPVPGLSSIVAIGAGDRHGMALASDGTVYAWGSNGFGQLGDASIERRLVPTVVRAPTSAHARFDATRPMQDDNRPPTASAAIVALGDNRAPARLLLDAAGSSDDGRVAGARWFISDGQTIDGTRVEVALADGGEYSIVLAVTDDRGAVAIARRTHFVELPQRTITVPPRIVYGHGGSSGAVTADGRALVWGSGSGLGLVGSAFGSRDQSFPVANGLSGVVQLIAPSASKLALLDDGRVYAWGFDTTGMLGFDSDQVVVNRPRLIVDLPPVAMLAGQSTHVLALTRDGRVFAWGSNLLGQLGLGDLANRLSPVEVPLEGRFVTVGTTLDTSYAVRDDGVVFGWGLNRNAELGGSSAGGEVVVSPRPIAGLPPVAFAGSTTHAGFFRASDSNVWVVGNSPSVRISGIDPANGPYRMPFLDEYIAFTGGFQHVVALHRDGTVATYGANDSSGGLGYLEDGFVDRPRRLEGLTDIVQISSSGPGAALRRDGRVFAWGDNGHGRLGEGTLAYRATPTTVVGEQGSGFLDLDPATGGDGGVGDGNAPIPPDLQPDVIGIVKSSGPAESKSATSEVRFDSVDQGREARVFVTALVPEGSVTEDGRLVPPPDPTAPLVAVSLTPFGYKQAQGGRVEALLAMPIGDRPARVPLFQNIPVESLGAAIFCVGYSVDALGDKSRSQATYGAVPADYSCPSIDAVDAPSAALVEKGWWWNPAESGRGYFIETQANRVFMVGYLYDDEGRAQWVGTYTNVVGGVATGPLYTLDGGQTLAGPYVAPGPPRTLGTISLRFTSPRTAEMTWPGGTLPIERAYFGAPQDTPAYPENGWWWNADEPGRGFAVEVQEDTAFVGGFMYDAAGRPTWYVAQATMSSPTRLDSTWLSFADGQALGGPYRMPRLIEPGAGSIRLEFDTTRSGRLTLPDGRVMPLVRFPF